MKKRERFFTILLIIVLFLGINFFGSTVKFVTDFLWFKEIGYTETFLTKLKAQVILFIPIFIVTWGLLYMFLRRLKKKYDSEIEVVDLSRNKKINLWIKLISAVVSLLFTLNVVSVMWFEILQFYNGESFNILDPVFNNDLSFYIFKLPLINTIIGYIINILFVLIVATVLFYGYLSAKDSIKNVSGQFQEMRFNPYQLDLSSILNKKFAEKIINQLSFIGIFVFLFLGIRILLRSYDLLYSQVGRVFGAGFTDINITLYIYMIVGIGCFVSAVTFFIGARKRSLRNALTVPAVLIIISIIGTGLSVLVEKYGIQH